METRYEVLLTVIDQGSFSKAAKLLFMTQPAVSQYIKQLETEIGASLFDRSSKKLQVTGAGRIVESYIRQLKELEREMERTLHTYLEEVKGEVSIGASYSFGEYILPNMLATFLSEYPEVIPKIDIHNTSDITTAVLEGKIDVGIIEGKMMHPQLEMRKLTRDEMVVVSSHADVNIHEANWILREKGSGTRDAMDTFLQREQVQPKRLYEYGSTQLIKESVIAGIGISYLSKWTIQRELMDRRICIIDEKRYAMSREFYCIQRKGTVRSKAVDVFVQHLLSHI